MHESGAVGSVVWDERVMITQLRVNGRWDSFVPSLANLTPFRCYGALRGEVIQAGRWVFSGRLSPIYRESVKLADYVVYSYDTPIAWHRADGFWHMPDVKYSVTTSKHQGRILTALCNGGSDTLVERG